MVFAADFAFVVGDDAADVRPRFVTGADPAFGAGAPSFDGPFCTVVELVRAVERPIGLAEAVFVTETRPVAVFVPAAFAVEIDETLAVSRAVLDIRSAP
jgi:hypothetical protein